MASIGIVTLCLGTNTAFAGFPMDDGGRGSHAATQHAGFDKIPA
jgi:hypothetical protein